MRHTSSLGKAQRMQKYLPQAAQAVELFRNRMSIDVSFRMVQSSGLAHSVWLLLQKRQRKKRDIAEVKGARTMWQAAPCWQILCGMHCFPNFFTSPQRIMFILWITNEKFFFWLSTLGTFFGTSFTQPEQEPELLMVWALLIYTYQWLKIPLYCSYCTVFQCTGGKQSYCLPYVSNNKHKTGN